MILARAEGLTHQAVALRVGASSQTVRKWRRRFLERGVQGLHDELRPGRPRSYDAEKVAQVIHRALYDPPAHAPTWSVRLLGAAEGIAKTTVQRWCARCGVKPHLARPCKLSNDPFCIEKVRDIVGLYLHPCIRRTLRWCCVWTKKPQFRPWSARSPLCLGGLATARGTRTTMSATAPPPCARPWTPPRAG